VVAAEPEAALLALDLAEAVGSRALRLPLTLPETEREVLPETVTEGEAPLPVGEGGEEGEGARALPVAGGDAEAGALALASSDAEALPLAQGVALPERDSKGEGEPSSEAEGEREGLCEGESVAEAEGEREGDALAVLVGEDGGDREDASEGDPAADAES